MKKPPYFLLAITAVGAMAMAMTTSAVETASVPLKLKAKSATAIDSTSEEKVSGLIVKPHLKKGVKLARALEMKDAAALTKLANVGMTVVRPMSGGAHVIKLDKPVALSEARRIVSQLMQDAGVEMAEPDLMMRPFATPTDPFYGSQWHYYAPSGANLGGANLPSAWDVTTGSAAITVAVIDTGYRQHADLGTVLPGYDFITSTTTANDGDGRDADALDPGDWETAGQCATGSTASNSSWHGTHVAGTIAALMSNGLGGTGIAPNIRILPLRVLGRCGGSTSDIAEAMRWAVGLSVSGVPANPNPARVLNLSLGTTSACSFTMQSAVTDVVNAGAVVVAATGNDGMVGIGSPASCTGAIAVTAHAIDGDNAAYANIGAQTAISAPGGGCGTVASVMSGCVNFSGTGVAVYSLLNSGTQGPVADSYAFYMGTSMATPHVAGVVALMLSFNSSLTTTQIKSYLQTTSRAHPTGSTCMRAPYVGYCGAGLLDANAALTAATNLPPAISLTNLSQVVAPAATVALSSVVTPSSGRTITTYAWTQLSGSSVGTINNANTANASFTAPSTGTYTFQLSATDSAARTSTASTTVRVNSRPVLTAVAAQSVLVGAALNFTVGATDVDGDSVYFIATAIPTGATLSTTGAFSWPNPAVTGSYSLTYSAWDNDTNSLPGTVTITVTAPPPPSGGGGGGGGSLDVNWLLALFLLAIFLRVYRSRRPEYARR